MASNLNDMIVYQRDEMPISGCCFTLFPNKQRVSTQPDTTRGRVHSEPKQFREKKIDLTLAKRTSSQPKDRHHTQGSQQREKKLPQRKGEKPSFDRYQGIASIGSKLTSQRSSLKNSKVTFNHDLKIERFICINGTARQCQNPPVEEIKRSSESTAYLPMLSQISIVQEPFISRESININLYNFLSSQQSIESKRTLHEVQPVISSNRNLHEKLQKINNDEASNPILRLKGKRPDNLPVFLNK